MVCVHQSQASPIAQVPSDPKAEFDSSLPFKWNYWT